MRTLHADHLILDVFDSTELNQWTMAVNNNGVVIGGSYGPTPCPPDDELRRKAKAIAANLPCNIWS